MVILPFQVLYSHVSMIKTFRFNAVYRLFVFQGLHSPSHRLLYMQNSFDQKVSILQTRRYKNDPF